MVSSKETTPAAYLASLDPEHRAVMTKVRAHVKRHLPAGYVESMNWGMLAYEVPLSRYPQTYNKQPLIYVALAAQKNNYALYLTNLHDPVGAANKLAEAYKANGRRLDMGKSCLRFRSLEELPLDIIGEIIAETTVERLIARYEASRRGSTPSKTSAQSRPKTAAKRAATKTVKKSAAAPAKKAAGRSAAKGAKRA